MQKRRRIEEDPKNDFVDIGDENARGQSKRRKVDKSRGPANTSRGKNKRNIESVDALIEKSVKDLTKALKLSKSFERQKLGKRLKLAKDQHDDAQIQRLHAEIEVVKSLDDRSELARHHLYKVLLKTKSIRESPDLPPYVRIPGKLESNAQILNVTARLYNSNSFRPILDAACNGLREALGCDPKPATRINKATTKSKEERAPGKPSRPSKDGDRKTGSENGATGDDGQLSSGSEDHAYESMSESAPYKFLQRRLSSSDASNSDIASPFSEDSPQPLHEDDVELVRDVQKARPRLPSEENYISSPSPSRASTPGEDSPPPKKSSTTKAPPKTTHYLPALTHVGYISGSDSDGNAPSDVGSFVAPRKNRRGQRARQQIWEQKYGERAQHLSKSVSTRPQDRDRGWDAKRGAREEGKDGFGRDVGMRKGGKTGARRYGRADGKALNGAAMAANGLGGDKPKQARTGGGGKEQNGEGKLHPSWEAKKIAKEKTSISAFAGKKTTFT